MKPEELKSYTVQTLKMFLKTVKPWKKRYESPEEKEMGLRPYEDGWNDCIKEMKKTGDAFIKKIESLPVPKFVPPDPQSSGISLISGTQNKQLT